MHKKISVLVPAYNVQNDISFCIESILNQTFDNFELIIVNDGSSDDTFNICKKYAKKDKRVLLFSQENKGLAETRNVLINKASCDLIVFIDSDDYVDRRFLEILYKNLLKDNSDISICGRNIVKNKAIYYEKRNYSQGILDNTNSVLALNSCRSFDMSAWGKLYKKNLFNGVKYPKGKLSEDLFVIYQVLYKAKKISYYDIPLYYYRQRENSISHSMSLNFDHIEAADKQIEYFKNINNVLYKASIVYAAIARMHVFNKHLKYKLNLNNDNYFQLTKFYLSLFDIVTSNIGLKLKIQLFAFRYFLPIYKFIFCIYKEKQCLDQLKKIF